MRSNNQQYNINLDGVKDLIINDRKMGS